MLLRRTLRYLLPLLALCGVLAPQAGSSPFVVTQVADDVPAMWVGSNQHLLNQSPRLHFHIEHLDAVADTERIVISIPAGFGVSLAHGDVEILGSAWLFATTGSGAAPTRFDGTLLTMALTDYAASATAQACAPGNHIGTWQLQLGSAAGVVLNIPVAVDSQAGVYVLTTCFDDEHMRGLKISGFDFYVDGVFHNPTNPGRYAFDGVVTPFGADGSPSTATAYEVRAYQDLPQALTAKPTYNPTTKVFRVIGLSEANGTRKAGFDIDVFVSQSPVFGALQYVGTTVTRRDGTYVFTKKLSRAPRYMYDEMAWYWWRTCPAPSTAPAGCASYSVDGRGTRVIPVKRAPAASRRKP